MKNSKEYAKEYAKNNPDKIKHYRRKNYLKNKYKWRQKYLRDFQTIEYRQKKLNERMKYMYKWKTLCFELLGNKCSKCGFNDIRAIQIDHINGDGHIDAHKRNVKHYKNVAMSVQKGENRFQLLCCNCNWIKRVENKEYYIGTINRKDKLDADKVCQTNKRETTLFSLQSWGSTLHRQGIP